MYGVAGSFELMSLPEAIERSSSITTFKLNLKLIYILRTVDWLGLCFVGLAWDAKCKMAFV